MRCSFCGQVAKRGTGKIFVRKSGKILYFCSRKCEKNMIKLGRTPRKVRWTRAFRTGKGG